MTEIKLTNIPGTINSLLQIMAADICDNYCKWPEKYNEDEESALDAKCENCPLGIIG